MQSIDDINALGEAEFVTILGGVYESSPWVPEGVLAQRPFGSRGALAAALAGAVDGADHEMQTDLIVAHPDLGGKLARRGGLTDESMREQSRLGLDRLDDEEYGQFTQLNSDYRERFGFPFIICVGLVDKAGILSAFVDRLGNSLDEERTEALRQIHLIAGLRLDTLVGDE